MTKLPPRTPRWTPGRSNRCTMRRALGLLAAVLLFMASGAAAETSDTARVAVLDRGPVSRLGIGGLGPNVLPCLVASYSFAEATVQVTYTAAPIPPFAAWPAQSCASLRLRRVPASSPGGGAQTLGRTLSYGDPQGWHIFFTFPSGFRDANACLFVGRFVPRFQYFLGVTGGDPLSSFPAVLQP